MITIRGKNFDFNPLVPDDLERFEAASVRYQERIKAVSQEGKKQSQYMRECYEVIFDYIDDILGEGASKRIFEGTKVSIFDLFDVVDVFIESGRKGEEAMIERLGKYNRKRVTD